MVLDFRAKFFFFFCKIFPIILLCAHFFSFASFLSICFRIPKKNSELAKRYGFLLIGILIKIIDKLHCKG